MDFKNETQLLMWLKRVGGVKQEEKCGIRLDNRLVISVMRRQS